MQLEFDLLLRRAGNSLCISLPSVAAKTIGWAEGDSLKMIVSDTEVVIKKETVAEKKRSK